MKPEGIPTPNPEDIAFGKEDLRIPVPESKEIGDENYSERVIGQLSRVRNAKDRLALALLIRGEKPACVFNPQTQGVREVIAMLGLPSTIRHPDMSILVGKDPESLEQLLAAEDIVDSSETKIEHAHAMGRALGYPETAVQGFGDTTFNWYTDLPEKVRKSGIMELSNFGFSREHWKEELKSVIHQIESVKDIAPDLYDRVQWENLEEFK